MSIKFVAAAAVLVAAVPAAAQTVDGVRDAAYGLPKSAVLLNPLLASPNFSSANGPYGEANSYTVYLMSTSTAVFGYLQAVTNVRDSAYNFANLYFDLDRANNNGSDLGFEITNRRAFAFGDPFPSYSATLSGVNYAWSADGTGLEFSIANSLFTAPIPGVVYEFGSSQQFDTLGSPLTLRIAQVFNYDVAGGSVYGDDRLGTVTLGANAAAVPEPASWAMMVAGFALAGAAVRRRRTAVAAFA